MDIILRDCGSVGWLAIIEKNGKEIYRSGKHLKDEFSAYVTAMEWRVDHD